MLCCGSLHTQEIFCDYYMCHWILTFVFKNNPCNWEEMRFLKGVTSCISSSAITSNGMNRNEFNHAYQSETGRMNIH